ncbi:unnamed protein product [Closterium sp. NIES-64]|nr:unnamed protein product [Closterium sp. NIES-64]
MELKGVDENGKHAKAEIELHEDIIDPENPGGGCDLEACVDLARRFAQRLIKALRKRMADLRHFDGVGFFSPDKYPDRVGEQDAWVELHLSELLDMFKNKLPGDISLGSLVCWHYLSDAEGDAADLDDRPTCSTPPATGLQFLRSVRENYVRDEVALGDGGTEWMRRTRKESGDMVDANDDWCPSPRPMNDAAESDGVEEWIASP